MIKKITGNKLLFSFLLSLVFLVVSLFTLKDYGVSWDSAAHYFRGQAYLHYFLTGKLNYDDLPRLKLQGTNGSPNNIPKPRRSIYQPLDFPTAAYYLKSDSGHPPLNDILAAGLNYVFFQKLGLVSDLFAHNMFIVLCSSLTVFVVVYFMVDAFGVFPALVAFLSLSTYPLFWSESHFNIKDPVQTAFFSLAVLALYKSLNKLSIKWEILFIAAFSFGLAVKFNILFLPIIFLFFLIFIIKSKTYPKSFYDKNKVKKYLKLFLIWPLISLLFLFLVWPYLRQNIPGNLFSILNFYRNIGTEIGSQYSKFKVMGFNTYPMLWIIYSTPPVTLILFIIGVVSSIKYRKIHYGISILWLFWLLVPIGRVSLPGMNIYGGTRQIFEYLPVFCLFSGLGAYYIVDSLQKIIRFKTENISVFAKVIIILSFVFPALSVIKYYPNENVYFNFLIGGLNGAREKNFPYWGNSFGNVYKQGIDWINANAEEGAKLTLIQGNITNVPIENIRKDISFTPANFSGVYRRGEYIMELIYNNPVRIGNYNWEYLEEVLTPIHQIQVDGVSILNIWKNSPEYIKKGYDLKEYLYTGRTAISNSNNEIKINLGKTLVLSKIFINIGIKDACINNGTVSTSLDGSNWIMEKDGIPFRQLLNQSNINNGMIKYYFSGRTAKYVLLSVNKKKDCNYKNIYAEIYHLE